MHTTAPKPSIVVIPAYQPQQVLVESTRQLLAAGYIVVVVDDGSEAEYQPIFAALDERIHLVRCQANGGKGAALKAGFAYIRQTFDECVVITADADGQHRVADIEKVAREYVRHPGTLLLGARTFETRGVPLRSRFGNVLTRNIFWLITRQRLHDTQTGLRAFDESLIDTLLRVPGERFEYEMNVLLVCSREGVTITEVPIQTIYENGNETSHFNPVKDSLSIYGQIIKFASSSLAAFGIDYVLFLVLLHATSSWTVAASVTFANLTARLVSASFNFAVNKQLVFRHKGSTMKGALAYALLAAGILGVNTMLLTILIDGLGAVPAVAKIVTEAALFIASYFIQKNVIFAQSRKGAS